MDFVDVFTAISEIKIISDAYVACVSDLGAHKEDIFLQTKNWDPITVK